MNIKPLHKNFKMPIYATPGSAAFDIYAPESSIIYCNEWKTIGLGFAAEIPEGHVGLLMPRSGLGSNQGFKMRNTAGVIDSDYRGEWKATVTVEVGNDGEQHIIKEHDRILQCLIVPVRQVWLNQVDELSTTERGVGGYGSTGN